MADIFSKEKRSEIMSKIRSKNTKPELKSKKLFRGFKHNPKGLFGNPDFISLKKRTIVFIDGCFWHKCLLHYKAPKSNKNYWLPKLERNAVRDKEITLAYKNAGWKVVRIWEHELSQI